jgi:glycine cleavage system H protein
MSSLTHLHFAESHEWIDLTKSQSPVGITDFAQNELTDIVYVELPEVGSTFSAGDPVAVLESVKSASDIYTPVSGTITEVNEALLDNPALINEAAFTDGWLFKIEATNRPDTLLSADAYTTHTAQ